MPGAAVHVDQLASLMVLRCFASVGGLSAEDHAGVTPFHKASADLIHRGLIAAVVGRYAAGAAEGYDFVIVTDLSYLSWFQDP